MERPTVSYEDGRGDLPEGWYLFDGEDVCSVDLLEREAVEAQIEALQRKLETLKAQRMINAILRRK